VVSLGFDFPSPERRLDISPTSGGLGELRSPACWRNIEGTPKGGALGSPSFWLLFLWRSKKK
jgi:hypothetical protein